MEFVESNVNRMFSRLVAVVRGGFYTQKQASRNGDTLEFDGPVMLMYTRPKERVLFSPSRDANPFFHFFESLWMLRGSNDVEFPASLVKRMSEYSDDGRRMQGAYGWRWRAKFGFDQIKEIITLLTREPDTRRAVLQMWEPKLDVLGEDHGACLVGGLSSKDIPCNTNVYFKIRHGKLNMTVCNRSNDLLWGALGANCVHMSMLQEYIAAHVGVPMGVYTQFTDSLHVYINGPGGAVWQKLGDDFEDRYSPVLYNGVQALPMLKHAECEAWGEDLLRFFNEFYNDGGAKIGDECDKFKTEWWRTVATPMWAMHKTRKPFPCAARDWEIAAHAWLARRNKEETK